MIKEQAKNVLERIRKSRGKIFKRTGNDLIKRRPRIIKTKSIKARQNLPEIKLLGIKFGLKTLITGVHKKTIMKPEIKKELRIIKKFHKRISVNKLESLLIAEKIIKISKGRKELIEFFVKENQLKEIKEFIEEPKKAIKFSKTSLKELINYSTTKNTTRQVIEELKKTIKLFELISKNKKN